MHEPPASRLALLYRISQTFNSSLDLDTVLTNVMDEVVAAIHAERGFLVLRDPADGRLTFHSARGVDRQTLDAPAFQISRGVVERVIAEGKPQLTSDAQSDGWLAKQASVVNLSLRSILCVPLQIKGTTLGVIYLDNRLRAGIFTPDDRDLLASIASSAAIAIDNARLYLLAVERGKLERELQLAFEVQSSLLPHQTPRLPGWDLSAVWRPARTVAGDLYDFIPGVRDRLSVVIGDVADKGMAAALFMALTRSVFRAAAGQDLEPAECMAQANRLICADATNGMFVTFFMARIEPGAGRVGYVNAGHNMPLLARAGQPRIDRLERGGLPLGIDESFAFEQHTVDLESGDVLLLYTDGVTEAMDAGQNEFGVERLAQVLLASSGLPAAEIAAQVDRAVREFVGPTPPFDDITFVVVKRL